MKPQTAGLSPIEDLFDRDFVPSYVRQVSERSAGKKVAFLARLLSEAECKRLIRYTERLGYEPLEGYDPRYRSNTRVIVHSHEVADIIFDRVKAMVPAEISKRLRGKWSLKECNGRWRFCRYTPGQHFSGHYDGSFEESPHCRSFITLNLYLNGGFEGGHTRFLNRQTKEVIDQVTPEPGLALVFDHDIWHDGEALGKGGSGVKYLMRTDIMYETT